MLKNILSYPHFYAYFLSSTQKTMILFISKMSSSFRLFLEAFSFQKVQI